MKISESMSEERKVGGLEKLVGNVISGIEKVLSPITKKSPEIFKSAYSSSKNVLLQYVCGSLDKVGGFVKEHPILTVAGVVGGALAFPYLLGYTSYMTLAVPSYFYPVMYPYMF